ncbi:unnamed protein product [Ostreobium quekettii]|uniref:RHOMBOID-like protein n=1 Tax=Ostreobium quekettii TaxID=121088 RepID=A0A8S1IWL2_9CHLO|nr:unnamed protein product [Ostreobium quekettii]
MDADGLGPPVDDMEPLAPPAAASDAANGTGNEENGTAVGTLSYVASMVFARKPVELYRAMTVSRRGTMEGGTGELEPAAAPQGLEPSRDVEQQGVASPAAAKFQKAGNRVLSMLSFRRHARALGDSSVRGADRLAHVVALEAKLAHHPRKDQILMQLKKWQHRDYKSFGDRMANELFVLGERIFLLFTPKELNNHDLIYTWIFFLFLVVPFFYMAGEFPRWLDQPNLTMDLELVRDNLRKLGPDALIRWIFNRGDRFQFASNYLILWGGRYIPDMERGADVYRWITSLLIHQDFAHLLNNSIIFLLFSTHLEHKYGTIRIGALSFFAGIGGNLLSAAFENVCAVVVGASGCCFGLLGLFVADMVLNFEQVTFPILRIFFLLLMLAMTFITLFQEGNTSHLSHAGGFLAGLFPSFVFLPNLHQAKWEAILPYLGFASMLFFYLVLPIYVYSDIIPNNNC